jgi:hypothetical protein
MGLKGSDHLETVKRPEDRQFPQLRFDESGFHPLSSLVCFPSYWALSGDCPQRNIIGYLILLGHRPPYFLLVATNSSWGTARVTHVLSRIPARGILMVVVKEDSPTRIHLRYPTICPECLVCVSLIACCFLHVSVTIPHNGNLANIRCPRTIDGNLAKQVMARLNLWVITQMGGMHIPHLLSGVPIGPIMMNSRQ